ncbi:cardiolipin synthase [Palleronia sediminis]|uniref:Cardiolipin synthase n=1 Tax=Palleronia sediminis TaxID=2547833 RepID=A0A4R6A5Q3_9RHOB|nr:cardiolipin synthase [Palleronia sediminis]TDL78072.1 cardiolipin synthase [Palleronia sediminis]
MVSAAIFAVVVLLQIAALFCAWRAIVSARTPQGALGWVVFLLAAPYIGVLLYLFLGHHRYRGYLIARRESERVIDGLKRGAEAHAPAGPLVVDPTPFTRIADLPVLGGNRAVPLIDGDATFDAIFAAIDRAERYVLAQFYIVHDDGIGRAFRDRLIAAAGRGVRVMFMTDAVGSHSLPESYYAALRDAGVEVADPKGGKRPRHRFQINFRNHRKTVVVDGRIGFTGGLNVGDEYLGRDPRFGNWRDTHLELRGPVVAQLQLVFAEDWHWAGKPVPADILDWTPPAEPEDMAALIVPTGPGDSMETGALFFFAAIVAARRRIWIASPYCVPDTDVLTAMKHAALAGREVRLLVPDMADHLVSWLAAFAYFDELREAGVEIWRYGDGFMHQKVVLIDDDFAAIGTTNFDNRSFRLNFEAMAAMFDPRAAQSVEAFLRDDFDRAARFETDLADQPLRIRVGGPVARLFAPLL